MPGIAGIVRMVKEGYPDVTAFDPKHHHYDAESTRSEPRWYVVDVKLVRKFKRLITLDELRKHAKDELVGLRDIAARESTVGDAGVRSGVGIRSHSSSEVAHIASTL